MPTTTTSSGTARSPRISKRASTRRELGAVERVGGVEQHHEAEREQRHRREHGPAQAAGGRAASHELTLTDCGAVRARSSYTRRFMAGPRVALIHDFLLDLRGAERVFAAICDAWPEADIFTAVYDERGTEGRFADRTIHTSFLQRVRPTSRTFRPLLPLYPHAIESFDLSGYDTVISSSSAWAHGVLVDPGAVHVCYCHNPFRYAWTEREATLRARNPPSGRRCAGLLSQWRQWDWIAAQRVDRYVANSHTTAERVRRYLGARVDRPAPAGGDRPLHAGRRSGTHYVVLAELMAHKRIDVAVEAFSRWGCRWS